MGHHAIPEQAYLRDSAVMLYAPLSTLIYIDPADRTRLAVDQPSTVYASFADPVITEVGLDRDRQLAELLDALWRRGGPGMLQRGQRRNAGEGRTGRGALAGRSGSTGRFAVDVPAAAQ